MVPRDGPWLLSNQGHREGETWQHCPIRARRRVQGLSNQGAGSPSTVQSGLGAGALAAWTLSPLPRSRDGGSWSRSPGRGRDMVSARDRGWRRDRDGLVRTGLIRCKRPQALVLRILPTPGVPPRASILCSRVGSRRPVASLRGGPGGPDLSVLFRRPGSPRAPHSPGPDPSSGLGRGGGRTGRP